jgi:Holliday junction DNA helicase RuvA
MIRLLTGHPISLLEDSLVVDVHGVGYEVYVPAKQIQQLSQQEKVTLHIYTHVREDSFMLFGFSQAFERQVFVQLLDVSGVGPRSALAILDKGADAVVEAIQQSDVGFFQSVPRLGKKTAQKIIVELQSKMGSLRELNLTPLSQITRDVRDALVQLGYNEQAIDKVVSDLDPAWDIATALKWSMQNIGKQNHV